MAVSFVAGGGPAAIRNNSGSTTLTAPTSAAGAQVGDTLVAVLSGRGVAPFTTPSGWTALASGGGGPQMVVFYKIAASADLGASFSFGHVFGDGNSYVVGEIWAYRGVTYNPQAAVAMTASSGTLTPPTVAVGQAVLGVFDTSDSGTFQTETGANIRQATYGSIVSGYAGDYLAMADWLPSGTNTRGPAYLNATSGGVAATVVLSGDQAPNAPTLTGPANNSTIDRTITQRFTWTPSDPDAGDTQSKFDLRYSSDGGSTWTTVTQTTTNSYYDFAANTFSATTYQWQVRAYDSQGVVGPWSASSFFTAAVPPTPPSITAPTSGGTVGSSPYTVAWSTPDQQAYQVRRVADNAGAADTNTVYYDTGQTVNTIGRSVSLPFETNNRWEHVEVRIQSGGLWSSWADVRVDVSYTPPATPTVTCAAVATPPGVQVTVTNPTPSGGQPTVTSVDIYRRLLSDGGNGIRVAADVTPGVAWTDYTVASRETYQYLAVAKASSSGTSSSSTWAPA